MSIRRFLAGVTLVLALAALVVARPQPAAAQQPAPQTVAPGSAAIWVDKQQYLVGDPVLVCYTIPVAGQITITNVHAGNVPVFYQGPSQGTSGCMSGVITPPLGQNCLRLTYPLLGGLGQTQTCYQVIGSNPPPPPSGLSIRTDRSSYPVGSAIQVCYSVPAPGPIVITDTLANGQAHIFFSGYDDGTGGCIPGVVTPPAGTECMSIGFTYANGVQIQNQTCFQVTDTPPPANWIAVGTAQVDGNGNWNFDSQFALATNLTYVRVTSGTCSADPASTLVWESNLLRQSGGPIGVDVWSGSLEPTGLTTSSGGAGSARIARPVTLNPVSQIDATLFSVGIVYSGTTLTVCFRAP